ncbi:hypothetical protein [Amycolatopsis sp. TNS106]|uniref:hypothetical protein n=1 Tax=Amycolatopsis sp. TNS106 TaxID=2861750 RepID=UPI001C5718E4|nr:hypothetical protein [Amycolatopsis sp. TNS106]QXV56556.1 hypothetical protein CVV72_05665 [Amycolatopsis sp. TNS106]
MTQPGPPGRQPYPQQQHYHQQSAAWQPPLPHKRKAGPLIAVLVIVLVVVLGGGGVLLYFGLSDSGKASPRVDASQDLEKAPGGCAVFTEAEVAPYIPGRMDFKPISGSTSSDRSEQGQCSWNNNDHYLKDKVSPAFVIVTSYVFHATREQSGVDAAKGHLKRRVPNGGEVGVQGAEDALLVPLGKTGNQAKVAVRYRNVVYHLDYLNKTEGVQVRSRLTELAAVVVGKVVPKG